MIETEQMKQATEKYQNASKTLQKYVAEMNADHPNHRGCIDDEKIITLATACLEAQAEYLEARDDANPPVQMYDAATTWG